MRALHTRWLATAMLGAVVLAGASVRDAAAKKKPRSSMTAKVNGKAYKGLRTSIVGSYGTSATGIGSSTKVKPRRIGGVIRALGVVCTVDVKTLTLPATLTQDGTLRSCTGEYEETRLGTPGRKKWPSSSFQVTFKSRDGLRVQGEFAGTHVPDAEHPADPVVTITKGKFSVLLTDLGI